jgi:dihydroxyacetone kinase-like protein
LSANQDLLRDFQMKKLINNAQDVVKESLAGFAAAHGEWVDVHLEPAFVVRADAPVAGKVGIVSGGGSGHEPMHAGFVGKGMLDAACPGEVFTSPTPDQMQAATKAVDGGAGVLHIVKNYTGDVMNFEMAAELCLAEGIDVESVTINDDVAVEDSLYTAGRRGVGTTVLAEKICGAAAEKRMDLQTVAALCRKVNANGRSMGMALTSCTVPEAGKPTFGIEDDQMEIGIGIHGEPGRTRKPLADVHDIIDDMAAAVIGDLGCKFGDRLIAMVNGMGATPLIELYIAYGELAQICTARGMTIARCLVGNFITSLDMAGCSITLLKADNELLELWDAPVCTPGLRWGL